MFYFGSTAHSKTDLDLDIELDISWSRMCYGCEV